MTASRPILIVGGSGVFGRRLAEGLSRDGVTDLIIAGRSLSKAEEVARTLGARAVALDIGAPDLDEQLATLAPFCVVDAAGPFQAYGDDPYRLALAALKVGAHYLDLSDDGPFTAGIAALDADARKAGRAVLSGVSSVPAVSAAAVRALTHDMPAPALIESMILPGNRAPRGTSVFRAILAQVGKPLPGTDEIGWIGSRRVSIPTKNGVLRRLASPIGAPDTLLMPDAFNAREVRFRAGLELPLMHHGLGLIARLVRIGLLPSALPLTRPLLTAAKLMEPFGSDIGAMLVRVRGTTEDGQAVERRWTLVARAGDGPHVPAIAGRVHVAKLLAGDIAPGARPALFEMDLEEVERAAPELALDFATVQEQVSPLFRLCLGETLWAKLPPAIQELHRLLHTRRWTGEGQVTRGTHPLARLLARMFRFPPATDATPVTVAMTRDSGTEHWERSFGAHVFRSHLTPDPEVPGRMWERFGPFTFAIDFGVSDGRLTYPVAAGRLFGLPIPRALLPRSDTSESVDEKGRVTFDVGLSVPIAGDVVRYRGWLVPED